MENSTFFVTQWLWFGVKNTDFLFCLKALSYVSFIIFVNESFAFIGWLLVHLQIQFLTSLYYLSNYTQFYFIIPVIIFDFDIQRKTTNSYTTKILVTYPFYTLATSESALSMGNTVVWRHYLVLLTPNY